MWFLLLIFFIILCIVSIILYQTTKQNSREHKTIVENIHNLKQDNARIRNELNAKKTNIKEKFEKIATCAIARVPKKHKMC